MCQQLLCFNTRRKYTTVKGLFTSASKWITASLTFSASTLRFHYKQNKPNSFLPLSDRRLQKQQTQLPELAVMYKNMQMELSRICGRLQTLEQSQRSNNGYETNNRRYQEEYFSIKNAQAELRRVTEKLQYQSQIVFEWKRHVDTVLENLRQQCKTFEKIREESDKQLVTNQTRKNALDSIIADINLLGKEFNEERVFNREIQNDLKAKIEEFKDFYMQENATVTALWNDQKLQVEKVLHDIEKLTKCLEEQKLKFNTVIFDLRSTSQTASESAQKVEILERDFAALNSDVAQLKLDQQISEIVNDIPVSTTNSNCCGRIYVVIVKKKFITLYYVRSFLVENNRFCFKNERGERERRCSKKSCILYSRLRL